MRNPRHSENHPLQGLYDFLLREFEAIPTSGEAVTADVRPHFNALCEYMARDATPLPVDAREALEREIAELEKAQGEAKQWGAAVGARHEMLEELYAKRAALQSEGEPGRIAELEREIIRYDDLWNKRPFGWNDPFSENYEGEDMVEQRGDWLDKVNELHAELSRLRNEQPKGAVEKFIEEPTTANANAMNRPASSPGAQDVRERVRHVKRGSTYRIIGKAQVQCEKDDPLTDYEVVVIYQCEQDGEIWVRRVSEFDDGRFEKLPAALAQSDAQPTHRDMAYFGASEAAGYHYPGEDQQLLRDAYCRGAAEYAPKPADAQPVVQSQGGEPVAYQYRARGGDWQMCDAATDIYYQTQDYEIRPLYATPPASPDGAVREALDLEGVKRLLDDLQAAYAWSRELDYKETVTHKDLVQWANRRPIALFLAAVAALEVSTAPPQPGLIGAACLLDKRADEHLDGNQQIEQGYRMAARFLRARAASDRSA